MYALLKQIQASQGDYRAAVCIYREKIREAKALLELTLAIVLTDNKKDLKHVNSKRMSKEDTVLILDEDDHLANRDEEKTCLFSTSVFSISDRSWVMWSSELQDHGWENSDFPFVISIIVRSWSHQLIVRKSLGPTGFKPQLVEVVAGPFPTVYQMSWDCREVSAIWKLVHFFYRYTFSPQYQIRALNSAANISIYSPRLRDFQI